MIIKMNHDFLLKYVFASFLIIMLLSVAFFYDRELQEQNLENTLLALTKDIGLLDLERSQAVLKMNYGFDNWTEINRLTTQLNDNYQILSGKISTMPSLYDHLMHSQLDTLYSNLYQRRQAIEKFNRNMGSFNWRLIQFQQLGDDIIHQDTIDSGIKTKVSQLQRFTEQYYLNFSIHLPTTPSLLNELSRHDFHNPEQKRQLAEFEIQARGLFKEKAKINLDLNAIIKIKTPPPAEAIEQTIISYFNSRQEKKSQMQNKLFFIAILSVLFVVYLLSSLRKKSTALTNVLADIEKQQVALNQHAIVSATDVKGNITYVNSKFCEISGYSAEELMGQNHRILKSGEHSKEVYEDMWHTICHGKVWHGEIKNKTQSGGFYWVNGTIVPFMNEKGKPYHYISIRTDITRQKILEKQLLDGQHFLKQVTDAMAQGLYALDEKGFCTFWNKEAENILGWTEHELLHKDLHEIIHFQNENGLPIEKQNCLSHQAMENNTVYSSDAEFFTHKDGRILPISLIAVPLLENNGTIGTVAVFSDITQRKENERIINQAIINAQQASQAKSDFLANMSHEIRTPMNGIIGMTELTLETNLNAEQREFLEIVKDSSYALLAIVNDILDFSKIEAGKLVLEQIDFDINDLLKRTLAVLMPKADQKGIKLSLENEINDPSCFQLIGDPGRLRQVILNLVGNAIKFTLHGCIKVSVSLVDKNAHQCCLLFAVADTGIGIPKNKQNSIFEAFSQADTSVTRRFGGTGLGLSISKQFIELMAGNIWLESETNVGTTFFFTCWFDYENTQSESLEAVKPSNHLTDQQKLSLGSKMTATVNEDTEKLLKLNILLAEDNLINQKLAKKLLEKQGYDVQIANNGKEAVELFGQQPFDLILMDFQMPEMNGLEAAVKIRKQEQQKGGRIPIIAMTANAMKEDKERAIAAGMDAYVPKPINVQELLTQIDILFPTATKSAGSAKTQVDDESLCNWKAALGRLGGETEILEMLVNLFLEEQSSYLSNIKRTLAEKNALALQRELHTLRGVCATIGAEKMEQDIKKPEVLAEQGDFAACAELIPQIEQDLLRLSSVLRKKMKLD